MKFVDMSPDFLGYLISDKDAIRNSIKNIILIRKYSLMGNPSLGSKTMNLIFTGFDDLDAAMFKMEIMTVLKNKEPRINVIDVLMEKNDNHEVNINIFYSIKNSLIDSVETVRLNLN
jgi:phage baseplate assembly protein W